ncbi:TPA: LPXTG cell wall anchor domain-containing protein, partial [Staphylococcus aureus]|nr:LPXTG cell wall anchor domain-containing protein [Staphylococcus aureus]HDF5118868.1 LPXTG cell wall anchor domain-containing protein [Staphylococcus aureus]
IYKTTSIIGNKNNQQKVAIDNKTIEKDLPETGETDTDNGTIFASLFATIGSLLLFVKRRKTKEDEK